MKDGIEILDAERSPISEDEMLQLMGWTWGEKGVILAKLWRAFRDKHFGALQPLPIWLPPTFPYGYCIGLFTANPNRESLSIQIKYGLTLQEKADTLLHEMIHQELSERGDVAKHNATPWCSEIMRLGKEIWNYEFWASPALPKSIEGPKGRTTVRVQKDSETGERSISRKSIASFPQSLKLSVNLDDYL
jgi:hypothetical protein